MNGQSLTDFVRDAVVEACANMIEVSLRFSEPAEPVRKEAEQRERHQRRDDQLSPAQAVPTGSGFSPNHAPHWLQAMTMTFGYVRTTFTSDD